jgi:ABC-type transport system involved in multi-copper enzyme maturation permease subunit
MARIRSIAWHTFKEAARDRVLYNLIVFALLMIGAAILFGQISVGIEGIILVDLGLSSIAVFGQLMAILIGIGLVSKEIERRTIFNVLSKPVRRFEFILGKYLGLLLTLLINTGVMTVGFYLALFAQKRHLGAEDALPLGAIYFILLQFALVVAWALFFSCISTPVLSAVFTFSIYVAGHFLAELRFFGQETHSRIVGGLTSLLYYLLPNFADFDVITRTAHGEKISRLLFTANSLYALLYVTVLISATILVFEEKEFR